MSKYNVDDLLPFEDRILAGLMKESEAFFRRNWFYRFFHGAAGEAILQRVDNFFMGALVDRGVTPPYYYEGLKEIGIDLKRHDQ